MASTDNTYAKPFIVDKNLGANLDPDQTDLTRTNADGKPVVELTQEQKYVFDSKGWVLIPGVLTENEVKEMREFGYQLRNDPDSIPEHERSPLGGPMQKLSDHPLVVGFMNEFCGVSGVGESRLLRIPYGILQPHVPDNR